MPVLQLVGTKKTPPVRRGLTSEERRAAAGFCHGKTKHNYKQVLMHNSHTFWPFSSQSREQLRRLWVCGRAPISNKCGSRACCGCGCRPAAGPADTRPLKRDVWGLCLFLFRTTRHPLPPAHWCQKNLLFSQRSARPLEFTPATPTLPHLWRKTLSMVTKEKAWKQASEKGEIARRREWAAVGAVSKWTAPGEERTF